ncbi:polymer-forming cytoskeletal protein [Apibacter raozihei]|uniref:bactofilin family protein n=1 Tax=Apibacter raozihei TaxID=2500547 RepID=UPI000FE32751|nr:polymer-forming cytoskeletal protein [Apibacter raozihei]
MFNKKKNDSPSLGSENITTIIAEDCKIEGTINCKAFIKIDGQALGGITSAGGVILGKKGYVKGDVKTKELIIYGKIEGDVFADNLTLKETGSIIGNMHVKSFQVENGANYHGTVSMDATQISSSADKDTHHNKQTK